jgi:DNA-directed RNA polymerase specialized sigma24 family protein
MRTEEIAAIETPDQEYDDEPEDDTSYLSGHEGFDDWYRENRPRVLATVALRCGSVDVAADATDEAFPQAFARWNRIAGMQSPTGWVVTVALNVSRRRLRRRSIEHALLRRTRVPDELPGPAGELFEVVHDLPEPQRTIVLLRYVADLPQADIAVAMKVSRSTVSTALTAAHRQLKSLISDSSLATTDGELS